jgi:hypothetical protein
VVRNRRGILIGFALAAVLAMTGGAGYMLVQQIDPALPPPGVANREQLFRWLVTRDLALESAETQRALVGRIETECQGDVAWDEVAGRLNEAQRRQLWDNLVVLMEPWFLDEVNRWARLSGSERWAFIDRFLDRASQWRKAGTCLRGQSSGGSSAEERPNLNAVLFRKIEESKAGADPAQKARIEQFTTAVRLRQAWRKLMNFVPGSLETTEQPLPHASSDARKTPVLR